MRIMVRLRQALWRETGEGAGQGRSPGLMVQQGLRYRRRPGDQLSGVQVVVFFNSSAGGEGQGPEGRFFQTRAAEEQRTQGSHPPRDSVACLLERTKQYQSNKEGAETHGGKRRDQERLKNQGAVRG